MTQATATKYAAQFGYTDHGNKVHMGFAWSGLACVQGPAIIEVTGFTEGEGREDLAAALLAMNVRPSRLCGHCFAIVTRRAYAAAFTASVAA